VMRLLILTCAPTAPFSGWSMTTSATPASRIVTSEAANF
jgi:hypothetical protein